MRSMSYAFTALLLVAAIAAPAALARPAVDPWPALAHEVARPQRPHVPTWPADPQPIAPAVTQPAPSDDGFPWETVGLILVAAGIGLAGAVAVVRVRGAVRT